MSPPPSTLKRSPAENLVVAVSDPWRRDERSLDDAVRACDDWDEAAALASRHDLAPLMAHRLVEREGVPDRIRSSLVDIRSASLFRDRFSVLGLSEVLDALGAFDIHPILIKGHALAERLYATPEARSCKDTDLLVREEELRAADTAFRRLGFRPVNEAFYREFHYHVPYVRQRGRFGEYVELHWDVTPRSSPVRFDVRRWFARARPHTIRAGDVLLPPADDEVRHVAWHALNGGVLTLRDAAEIARLSTLVEHDELRADGFVGPALDVAAGIWSDTGTAIGREAGRRWLARGLLAPASVLRVGNRRWNALRHVCYWSLLRPERAGMGFLFRDAVETMEHDRRRRGSQVGFRDGLHVSLAVCAALLACIFREEPDRFRGSTNGREF